MWFRVFGSSDAAPSPEGILEHLKNQGHPVQGHFSGDDLGWFRADLVLPDSADPLRLDRYLAKEDEIRDELNAWAAWLESSEASATAQRLMQHMIETSQMFVLKCPRHRLEEKSIEEMCLKLCSYLAKETMGVYQVDNRGFFAPDGKLLVKE